MQVVQKKIVPFMLTVKSAEIIRKITVFSCQMGDIPTLTRLRDDATCEKILV